MFNELLKETSQIKEEDLKPETQAIVMELVNVQKKIQSLETKLAEIKATKKELSQPVIDALHQLDLQNIRVGKVLVSLNQGTTAASFKAVMDAVKNELKPAIIQLLNDTYTKLAKPQDPYIKVKVESVSEDVSGLLNWLSQGFKALLNKVTDALTKVERLLGINEAAELKEAASNMATVRSALDAGHVGVDVIGRNKEGDIVVRQGFFYRHGMTAEIFAENISTALTKAGLKFTIINKGEKWVPFRGGASVTNQSHWYATIRLQTGIEPEKQ